MQKAGCLFVALLALTSISLGQDSNLGGPISGMLVDDQAHSIRPVVGIPGSAYAGYAAVTDFEFASIAPDTTTGVIARGSYLYLIRRLDNANPIWRELSNQFSGASAVAWGETNNSCWWLWLQTKSAGGCRRRARRLSSPVFALRLWG